MNNFYKKIFQMMKELGFLKDFHNYYNSSDLIYNKTELLVFLWTCLLDNNLHDYTLHNQNIQSITLSDNLIYFQGKSRLSRLPKIQVNIREQNLLDLMNDMINLHCEHTMYSFLSNYYHDFKMFVFFKRFYRPNLEPLEIFERFNYFFKRSFNDYKNILWLDDSLKIPSLWLSFVNF